MAGTPDDVRKEAQRDPDTLTSTWKANRENASSVINSYTTDQYSGPVGQVTAGSTSSNSKMTINNNGSNQRQHGPQHGNQIHVTTPTNSNSNNNSNSSSHTTGNVLNDLANNTNKANLRIPQSSIPVIYNTLRDSSGKVIDTGKIIDSKRRERQTNIINNGGAINNNLRPPGVKLTVKFRDGSKSIDPPFPELEDVREVEELKDMKELWSRPMHLTKALVDEIRDELRVFLVTYRDSP